MLERVRVHNTVDLERELVEVLDITPHDFEIWDREGCDRVRVHYSPVLDSLGEEELRGKIPMATADLEDVPAWHMLGHELGKFIVVICPYTPDNCIVLMPVDVL